MFLSLSDDFEELELVARPAKTDGPSPLFRALRMSSVGLEMGVATAIGWAAGFWLDRTLGTGPWLMLVFLLLGVAAGFKGLLRAAREMQRQNESPPPDREAKP